ncbi:MAG: hypothetical protein R2794_09450 [Chitinophagales bacterium]
MRPNEIRKWQWIVCRKLHVHGMTIYPFIFIQKKEYIQDKRLVQHEHIHLRQQLEMLIIPFYFCYVCAYLRNRLRYKKHHAAYRNICFEREAYGREGEEHYLENRKLFSWIKYVH